jgi:putative flippase GtrA
VPDLLNADSKLRKILGIYWSEQFLRFLAVGGIAYLLNWLASVAFNLVLPFGVAIVLAYAVGMLAGYLLNRKFVFPYSGRRPEQEMSLFFLVNVAAFPFVWLIAYGLAEYLFPAVGYTFEPEATAYAIAILTPVFVNFAAHKFVTFRAA